MIKYFGPTKFRKEHEEQIATPIGETCLWCEESVQEGDIGTLQAFISNEFQGYKPIHHECAIRQVAGSVGHQLELCSCHGGNLEDPKALTRRQAAKLAADLFYLRQKYHPS